MLDALVVDFFFVSRISCVYLLLLFDRSFCFLAFSAPAIVATDLTVQTPRDIFPRRCFISHSSFLILSSPFPLLASLIRRASPSLICILERSYSTSLHASCFMILRTLDDIPRMCTCILYSRCFRNEPFLTNFYSVTIVYIFLLFLYCCCYVRLLLL